MSGVDKIPLRVPLQWDAKWFRDFVRDVLAKADTRNSIAGAGVIVSGGPNTPATISLSGDAADIVDGVRAFMPRPEPQLAVRAGSNVTVVRDALSYVVDAAPVEDENRVLAGVVFGRFR